MLFNSFDFFLFLPLCLSIYLLLHRKSGAQNLWLLLCSYFFYGCWDYRFLGLIAFSTLIDFVCGLKIHSSSDPAHRRFYLITSLLANLGLLAVFKYFNFFAGSLSTLAFSVGWTLDPVFLDLILPIGISFYTFQTLSYTIDIYRKKIEPTQNFIAFAAFVAFFPQLIAGPIERASRLLPQFLHQRQLSFAQFTMGIKIFLWGLFKKVVVADNLSQYVDVVFANQDTFGGFNNVIGVIFFAFQIYADFSGYSSMAIGLALMFGFHLMQNFDLPYFATSLHSFWKKWHISLSTWFRDYLYIPLGGNRVKLPRHYFNILITFVVSGLWHGANWTFMIWGGIHALFYIVESMFIKKDRLITGIHKVIGVFTTFSISCFAWIFFRAESLDHALLFIQNIFRFEFIHAIIPYRFFIACSMILLLLGIEGLKQYKRSRALYEKHAWLRMGFSYMLIILICLFGNTKSQEFIYFQF